MKEYNEKDSEKEKDESVEMENAERAGKIIKKYNKLEANRQILDTAWQEIAEFMIPRKAYITSKSSSNPSEKESRLYDTTASDALLIAAAGLMAWTTPKSEPWFSFSPSLTQRKNTAVLKWLGECTEIAQELLANSNFYTQRHESLIDKLAFGTSVLFSQVDDDNKTYFENLQVGTYVIEENYRGIVDTLIRKIELTSRQAKELFGEENLPDCVLECYHSGGDKIHTFLHCVKPRKKDKIGSEILNAPEKKAFESLYVHKETGKIVKESGYDSFPFHVGRYLTYNGTVDRTPFGYGPGFTALPEIRQLNYLQKMMDAYTEKAIFPPMLVPDTFEGSLDTNARSIIYYNSSIGIENIRPLEVTGNFNIALERINLRKNAIQTKFHVDLFQMIASRTQQKTATEILALQNEKLDAISPAFDRDVTEVIQPMLNRLFETWLIKGMLPPPPPEAFVSIEGNGTVGEIKNPEIVMNSRLSLAIRNIRNSFTDAQLGRISQIASFDPTVLDLINLDEVVKGSSFLSGMPTSYLRDDKETESIRQNRAAAQQQAQQAQMMLEAAKSLPEDVVKGAVEGSGLM